MSDRINQAVVFTKPLHHTGLPLSPQQLGDQTRAFLEQKGLKIVFSKNASGKELAERNVIQQHYLMYSKASSVSSIDELELSTDASEKFEIAFGKSWQDEVGSGKIMGNPQLLEEKGINTNQLFLLWNDKFNNNQTQKLQDGLLVTYLEELNCYCINGFYPAMEENFYHPETDINYYVLEFDPANVSWQQFRKTILGATDASKSDPESLRGQLYARYSTAVKYPGRDNFVHGSAGPVEGLIERIIHEPDFDLSTNPVGNYLLKRKVSLEKFNNWKAGLSISQLGNLFDATEEKNTDEALATLDNIQF